MNFPRHIAIACLPLVLLLSCGSSNKAPGSAAVPKKAETSGFKPFSQRIDERNGYAVDENGNWVPRNNKRSSFESQGPSPYFSGEYGKKNYKAGEYARKSWWGNKEFGRNSFTGDTDGSRFQSDSGLSGQRAREKGSATGFSGNYQAGSFATGSAREASNTNLGKPSDAVTDRGRESYTAPSIIDWREERALSIEQSRGLLGR